MDNRALLVGLAVVVLLVAILKIRQKAAKDKMASTWYMQSAWPGGKVAPATDNVTQSSTYGTSKGFHYLCKTSKPDPKQGWIAGGKNYLSFPHRAGCLADAWAMNTELAWPNRGPQDGAYCPATTSDAPDKLACVSCDALSNPISYTKADCAKAVAQISASAHGQPPYVSWPDA